MKDRQICVLVVGEGWVGRSLWERLLREGFQAQETENPAQAFDLIRQK